ncbi:hypothetical protein Tco_0961542 [Tanacetum coccineum]
MSWAKGVTTGTLVRYETSCSRLPVVCVIEWICMLACNHVEDVDVRKSGYFVGEPFSQLDLSVIGSIRGAPCGTEGDRIVDRLSDARSKAGTAESDDSYGGKFVEGFGCDCGNGLVVHEGVFADSTGYEKVVRIPLEGDEIFRVHGERTLRAAKALMNAKVDEPRISDIPVARDITDVFPEDLSMTTTATMGDALSGKERVKSRRVRGMILAAQSEAFKQENVILVGSVMDEAHASRTLRKTLEDIIRACVIDFGGSYHLSIRCAPFEALYERKCRSPVLWAKIGEGSLNGPELVQETTDKVVVIKEKLKAARDHQKSYADNRRKPFEFDVKDRVMLKILERIGPIAYRLILSEELSGVHDTFHVSNLKKCLADASLHVPLDEIKVDKTLRFVEEPVEIMDREIKSLKRSKISLVKVRWNSKRGPEFTWEREDYMKSKYP